MVRYELTHEHNMTIRRAIRPLMTLAMAGTATGRMVPLDDPSKTRCVTLDEVPYCN